MELWSRITGSATVELTAADPERILGEIVKAGICVWDVRRSGDLHMRFQIRRNGLKQVERITEKAGGNLKLLGLHGAYYKMGQWKNRPVLVGTILILLVASIYLPGRILFVEVEGNESVPARLIQETAAQFGLAFGASRRQVRSEKIKNEVLGAIDELAWVGVNTEGCTATITVRERDPEPEETSSRICNVVASTDGIIESVTLTRGTLLCSQGQAVRSGQVLVSGYKDLGICTRAVEAEAEIYALTKREQTAVLPADTTGRLETTAKEKKFSLLIGKKRINLYSDSGILPSTCGKMTSVKWLTLPGGLTLPVALIMEEYTIYETYQTPRQENEASKDLEDAARRQLLGSAVAGQILTSQTRTELTGNYWQFSGSYECREMIARQDAGIYLEGDTQDDPEDSERRES